MRLERDWIEDLVFGDELSRRFTQDSPVLPDVWLGFCEDPSGSLELLLIPHHDVSASQLAEGVRERLERKGKQGKSLSHILAFNQSTVLARMSFDEVVRVVLPLSQWWTRYVAKPDFESFLAGLGALVKEPNLADILKNPLRAKYSGAVSLEAIWLVRLIGSLAMARSAKTSGTDQDEHERHEAWLAIQAKPAQIVQAAIDLLQGLPQIPIPSPGPLAWSVYRNRKAVSAIHYSVPATKADAACRLFELSCDSVNWAVIDCGIDATHPAFRRRDASHVPLEPAFKLAGKTWANQTRVVATYDFTWVSRLLSTDHAAHAELPAELRRRVAEDPGFASSLRKRLLRGQQLDWSLLLPYIQVPHEDGKYTVPANEHGTHVAGILGADWPQTDLSNTTGEAHRGMCPDINLYDFRVLGPDGTGDEFSVITALQFVRHLNANSDRMLVHGINLSLSIRHDVANFACGRTPVCDECERLTGAGIIVVAAAGNQGYLQYMTSKGLEEGYRSISITDPGNAEAVITVGATHRYLPHIYGVSYFSSRGPTGDGRNKPDLVAPGEKIVAPTPGASTTRLDGTSMAAPHVSGAAALFIAKHREFAGQPARVKEILCRTATDLGRERYFQGAGLVDVLRALQSV